MIELNINPKVSNSCPMCGNVGQRVKEITVDYQVKNKNDISLYGRELRSSVQMLFPLGSGSDSAFISKLLT